MSVFEIAVQYVLTNESENFGISLRFIREIPVERLRRYGIFKPVDDFDVGEIIVEQARLIYKGEFWEGNNFDLIERQRVCNYIFDTVVAHGIGLGIKLVQRAICAESFDRFKIKDDGILGIETVDAINFIGHGLFQPLVAIRSEYYRNWVANKPKDEIYLDSWLNRCYDVFKIL